MSVTNEMQYKNHFDPITHKPPKFDIFGQLVKTIKLKLLLNHTI